MSEVWCQGVAAPPWTILTLPFFTPQGKSGEAIWLTGGNWNRKHRPVIGHWVYGVRHNPGYAVITLPLCAFIYNHCNTMFINNLNNFFFFSSTCWQHNNIFASFIHGINFVQSRIYSEVEKNKLAQVDVEVHQGRVQLRWYPL